MGTILLVLFVLAALINILFYIGYFNFATAKPATTPAAEFPISVIICAKNEADNLKNFLPAILQQDYPDFEVILVNDASVDNTFEVMEEFRDRDPRLKLVNVVKNEAFWGKKKYALTLGIKKAKNPYLLFTDADCSPQTTMWISHMARNFANEKSIILGYGGYFKNRGSFLNKLIRYETLLTAVQYFSYAKLGLPYMGVGRNLAYTSGEFYAQNGFATHLHIKSGDDDLFVNQAATAENTAICYSKESITRSVPQSNFKEWFTQKRRHISTAVLYKWEHRLLLATFFFSQFFFWTFLIVLLVLNIYWQMVIGVFLLRMLVQYAVLWKSAQKLEEVDIVWLTPVLDLFLVVIQFGIFIANLFSKPSNWK